MLLNESEIRRAIERVRDAFPSFAAWEYVNEINDAYTGFSLWGELVLDPKELMPRRFFITFDSYEATWAGHLTIGQHCYFWSSADVGDAHLLDTGRCATLEEAILTLKSRIRDWSRLLAGTDAGSTIRS